MSYNWDALNKKTIELLNKGDYEGALTAAEKAVSTARENGDLPHLALGLNNMGELYQTLGDFENAEKTMLESIEALPTPLAPSTPSAP